MGSMGNSDYDINLDGNASNLGPVASKYYKPLDSFSKASKASKQFKADATFDRLSQINEMYTPEKEKNEGNQAVAMVDAGVSVQKEWQNGSVRVYKQKLSELEPIPEAEYQKTLKATSGSKKLNIYGNTMKSTSKSVAPSPTKSKRSSV